MCEKKYRIDDFIDQEKKFLAELEATDLDRNWKEFRAKLDKQSGTERPKNKRSGNRFVFLALAASLLALISISLLLLNIGEESLVEIQRISASDRNSELLLEDGTQILLKEGSELSFPGKFPSKKREVDLRGEAFFDVSIDKSAFLIHTRNTTVEVVGTSFNVRESRNGDVAVSVLSGEVEFYGNSQSSKKLTLEAGTEGVYTQDDGQLSKNTLQSENFLFWQTDSLAFKNASLRTVFSSLEKHYDVVIRIKDEEILEKRLTTSFKDQNITNIMDELSLLFDLSYSIRQDTIIAEIQRR